MLRLIQKMSHCWVRNNRILNLNILFILAIICTILTMGFEVCFGVWLGNRQVWIQTPDSELC